MCLIGPCINHVFVCPVCGRVTGGSAEGGVIRACQVCPHRGGCSYRDLEDLEPVEHVCGSDCYLALIFGASKMRLKVGEP